MSPSRRSDPSIPDIHPIPLIPKARNENWTEVTIIDRDGKKHTGLYDSYYGTNVYWRRQEGGWWEAPIGLFLVRPHRSTMRHEYVDFFHDPRLVRSRECLSCPTSQSPQGQRP